jgi:hypothetical protein
MSTSVACDAATFYAHKENGLVAATPLELIVLVGK